MIPTLRARRRLLAAAFCLLFSICLATAQMTEEIFVRIDTVDGGSRDPGHQGWIEAYALDHGEATGQFTTDYTPVAFLKLIDPASVPLQRLLTEGTIVRDAEVEVCRPASTGRQCYYHLLLDNVTIIRRGLAGTACLDERACPNASAESIAFDYEGITWTYRQYDSFGELIRTITYPPSGDGPVVTVE